MGSLRTANKLIFIGLGGYVFYLIETNTMLWRMDVDSAFTWIFAFVVYDFFYYWFHRISHERQIFWASHVAHHQSEDYNLSTALRQTGTGALLTWVFYIPVFLIGVPSYVFVSVASLNLIYQFWVHSEHIPKLGLYEWIFVTPSNHRVHHAQNDEYIDKNYGGVFIIWDRMFGTFKEEDIKVPCIYGIRGPIRTFNPIWANLHIYVQMLKDIWVSKSLKDKLYVPIARTGWRSSSLKNDSFKDDFDTNSFRKYDPKSTKKIQLYAFIQFIALSFVGLIVLESGIFEYSELCIIIGMMAFTMFCTASWLDGKKAYKWESLRLLLLMILAFYALNNPTTLGLAIGLFVYILLNLIALPALKPAIH